MSMTSKLKVISVVVPVLGGALRKIAESASRFSSRLRYLRHAIVSGPRSKSQIDSDASLATVIPCYHPFFCHISERTTLRLVQGLFLVIPIDPPKPTVGLH
jgi:hypothetical protein